MDNETIHYYTFQNKTYTDYNYTIYSYVAGMDALYKSNVFRSLHHLNPTIYVDVAALIIGFIGNALTIFVIAFNKSMHTLTNYYLLNLAVADLLLLIGKVVWDVTQLYTMFFSICKAFHWIEYISIYASILTIIALSVERYLAVCKPFKPSTSVSRVIVSIVVIWIVALLSGYYQVTYLKRHQVWRECVYKISDIFVLYNVYAFVFYLVPLVIMIVLYTLIGIALIKSNRIQKQVGKARNHLRSKGVNSSTKKSIKMLVAVVAVFFVCWTTHFIGVLFTVYMNHFLKLDFFYVVLYMKIRFVTSYIQNFTFLLSIVANPIIYSIMSKKFGDAFKGVFTKLFPKLGRKI